jgi:Ion channel
MSSARKCGMPKTVVDAISEIRRLRQKHTDRLLTLLAVLLGLAMFVFAPLQAVGIYLFQGFAIIALLAVIGGMIIISENPVALVVMAICLVAIVVIFLLRLYFHPWPYNLYGLAGAWLAIAITVGVVVGQAVFRPGRVTYHRIVGAILLYLLIAVAFGAMFTFVGLSLPDAFKGITFEDNPGLANSVFYLSFVTLTSTGYGDIVPVHPIARSLCNIESVIGQLYPATLLARLVTLELRQRSTRQ